MARPGAGAPDSLQTLLAAAEARIRVIAVEAGKTLLLDRDAMKEEAERRGMTIYSL